MPDRHTPDIAALLAEALALAPSERSRFLDASCAGNAELRRDLDNLIAVNEQAGDFLQRAAIPTGLVHDAATIEKPHEVIGERIGPYKVLQLIGEGGFGSVYMAEQEQPVRRRVALKVIKLGMDTRQVIARFEAERQALAIMDHPGIARVFDAGSTSSGRPYFVMELVRGEPITAYCDRHRLPINERLTLFQQVCAAVQHAHQKGVIHRDIKPSNVLIALHDGVPMPKIIDFGIAKATSARLTDKTLFTEFRQLIGTPEYMSPEQSETNATDIDTRADVYSLGVLLYELLTGTTPFDGKRLRTAGFGEMQRIIREEDPPRPSTRVSTINASSGVALQRAREPGKLRSELRGDLDWIVMKALEKDRTRRYDSAAAFADDVRRHMNHEPVLAGSPSTLYRFGKFIRRHRVQAAAVAVIALALIGGSAGTLIGMLRAREAAIDAKDQAARALAISDFLSDVLTSAEPDERGEDVRLVEVINDAARTAPQRFAGYPELEAEVRAMLAQVYARLSKIPAAKSELLTVVDIWRREGGDDDRRTIAAHLRLANLLIAREETSQAEAILRDTAPRIARLHASDTPVAMELLRLEGMIDMLRGRYDDADHKLNTVRQHLFAAGDDDALQLEVLEGLVRVQRRRFYEGNETDTSVLETMEALVLETIERSTRVHGPVAQLTLDSRLRLADIQWQTNKCSAAVANGRTVLASLGDRYSNCHSLRDRVRFVLALALSRLGEAQEAADLWAQRLDCMRQIYGRSHDPFVVSAMSDAMRIFDRAQRYAEGEAVAREVAAVLHALGGGHDAMARDAEQYVALFVSMQGRYEEADALFQPLLALPPDAPDSFVYTRVRMFHARHLINRGMFQQAEAELALAVASVNDIRQGTYFTHPDDLARTHVHLYTAWGKPELAVEYQQLCDELRALADGAHDSALP